MPDIPYESAGFPAGTVAPGHATLQTTWNDILWAAVTVGRPNRQFVFQHGTASFYEALFRWSLVRMSLEQYGPNSFRLRRTTAAKTLDPTEKGAINYFLGMTFCKLFASQTLNTPWLLHLDVFRPQLNPILAGRSRPDLVGQETGTGRWHAFECKGLGGPPDTAAKLNAKAQAQRLINVAGTPCSLHIGAITFFQNDVVKFYWADPEPDPANSIDVTLGEDPWREYYLPTADLISAVNGWEALISGSSVSFSNIGDQNITGDLDLRIEVFPPIAKALMLRDWNGAHRIATDMASELSSRNYKPDGLRVVAGGSWSERYREPNMLPDF